MKKTIFLLIGIFASLVFAGCEKIYVENYSSIYRTDSSTGEKVCTMFTSYEVNGNGGTIAMTIYYSGNWTANFTETLNWAVLDRTVGKGVEFLRMTYTLNDTGSSRDAVIHLVCDNGESVDITIKQLSVVI